MTGRHLHVTTPTGRASHRAPAPGLGHTPTLDGFRGIAILLVLAHNLDVLEITRSSPFLSHVVKELLYLGWIGVQLFFVLSGYLITRGLIASNGQRGYFRDFYIKRSLRIFPLYFLSLLVLTVLLPTVWPTVFGAIDPGDRWLWLYLSNWTEPLGLGGGERLPHFWSLAVEEQFYLVWPFLLYRRTPMQILCLSLLVVVAGPSVRWEVLQAGYGHEALYAFTICRMDALAVGAALAAWHVLQLQAPPAADTERSVKWGASAWLSGVFLLIMAAAASHGFQRTETQSQVWSYSLLAVSFALLLAAAAQDVSPLKNGTVRMRGADWLTAWPYLGLLAWQKLLSASLLRTFGKYSYALYVFHKPLHDILGPRLLGWMTPAGQAPGMPASIAYFLAMTGLTFLLAWVSWRIVEQPMLALRHRFIQRPPRSIDGRAPGPCRQAPSAG